MPARYHLQWCYVFCLRAFLTFTDFERYFLTIC